MSDNMSLSRFLEYSDTLLIKINDMLPGEWMKLGVFLNIPHHRLKSMLKIKGVDEMGREMLQHWWQSAEPETRWQELHHALLKINRADLVKKSRDFFKRHSINYDSPKDRVIHKYFIMLSESIPTQWKDLGSYLYVPEEEMRIISFQPEQDVSQHAYKVMKMWQREETSASYQLLHALIEINRMDVLRMVFRELDQSREDELAETLRLHNSILQEEEEEEIKDVPMLNLIEPTRTCACCMKPPPKL